MSHVLKDVIKNFSIDCVVFGFEKSRLEVLLTKRAVHPSKGMWALPGGFIKKQELVDHATDRILHTITGVKNIYLEEVAIFDEIDRFPSWRVFTIGYFALISPEHYAISAGMDSMAVRWFDLNKLPSLPFDHRFIIQTALDKLRTRVRYKPIGFELLPKKFTLPQLQRLYEVILHKHLDKRNFRKKLMTMGLVKKLNEKDPHNKRRAAYFYQFDRKQYTLLKKTGFMFEL